LGVRTLTDYSLLVRAQEGDEQAFAQLVGPYRGELQLHCYRIVGSSQDAEDLLQETLLAVWRGLRAFEGRSSLRTWLLRVATSRCLSALRDAGRRPKEVPMPSTEHRVPSRAEPVWLQPYPDILLVDLPDRTPGPEARYETRESIELAFIVGLQRLPPLQRATLVLRDVLSFRTAEVAEILETTEASVKGALQRARATLDAELSGRDRDLSPLPNSPAERAVMTKFVNAIERGDVDGILAVLSEDARLVKPPERLEYRGRAAIEEHVYRGTPLRVISTRANTQPALACYIPDSHAPIARACGMMVLTLRGDEISALVWFTDTAVFPLFGLPRSVHR